MIKTLTVDNLTFEIRRSTRRKTLGLTVDRGGELIISAPPQVSDKILYDFIQEKRFWLYTKLAEKEARQQPVITKEFVSGEGFSYLGRSYRLLLVDEQQQPLKLTAGRFKLLRHLAPQGRKHFIRWYTGHGRSWIRNRMKNWTSRMNLKPAGRDVRDLGFRWGSCSSTGNINFHWATILLPPSIIDYIIVHELAHLKEPNHTPEFWLLVGRTLPEYEQRKSWLAENGGKYTLL